MIRSSPHNYQELSIPSYTVGRGKGPRSAALPQPTDWQLICYSGWRLEKYVMKSFAIISQGKLLLTSLSKFSTFQECLPQLSPLLLYSQVHYHRPLLQSLTMLFQRQCTFMFRLEVLEAK